MRRNILEMAYLSGSSSTHFGGGLSIVDITATLYGSILNLNPKKPEDEVRDRFILSKGHGVLGITQHYMKLVLSHMKNLRRLKKMEPFYLDTQS